MPRAAGQKKKVAHTARLSWFFDQTCDPVGVRIAFRCRAYPGPAQQQVLARTFGCVRVVWNRTLAARQVRWHPERKGTSYAESDRALTAMKRDRDLAFLSEVSCVPLQQALRHQHRRSPLLRRARPVPPVQVPPRPAVRALHPPRVHPARWSAAAGQVGRSCPVRVVLAGCGCDRAGPGDGYRLPRAGRPLVCDLTLEVAAPVPLPETGHAVGIDLGVTDFAVTSDGQRIANPRHLERKARSLARYQRRLARCQNGSANRAKAAAKVARAHRKVRDARRDFLHRATTRLVRTADLTVIEDLNVCGMLGNRHLARVIADCGWGEFRRQLAYKCQRYGRELVVINRWYPSSKTCSACGYLLAELSLSTRNWTCPSCGARHDRDVNAAKNILAAGRAVARDPPGDACGAGVRHSGSPRVRPAVKQESRPVRAGIPVLRGGE